MKVYNRSKEELITSHTKQFVNVKIGELFVYSGVVRIKTNPHYTIDVVNGKPEIEVKNAMRIGSTNNKHSGESSIFRYDTLVDVYPDAAVYLKG